MSDAAITVILLVLLWVGWPLHTIATQSRRTADALGRLADLAGRRP